MVRIAIFFNWDKRCQREELYKTIMHLIMEWQKYIKRISIDRKSVV